MRSLYFRQTGPNFITQPQHYYFTPSYTAKTNQNIVPNSLLSPSPSYPIYPYVPTQFNQNIVPSTPVSASQTYRTYPYVPTQLYQNIVPSPPLSPSMQKWVHEPNDSLWILGDLNCNYNFFPYQVDPNVEIVIKGQFPYARYMSYSVTGVNDVTLASIPDRELISDSGGTNPFLPGSDWNAKNRKIYIKNTLYCPT